MRSQTSHSLPGDAPLLYVPTGLVRILNGDLSAAGIPKRDERGWTVDVHAIRHTFVTLLSKAGVPPRTAQAAARHSSMDLTMNVYTDPKLLDVQGALDALPALSLDAEHHRERLPAKSTGTDDRFAPAFAPTSVKPGANLTIAGKTDRVGIARTNSHRVAASGYHVKEKDPLTIAVNGSGQSGRAALHLCERNHRVAAGADRVSPSL